MDISSLTSESLLRRKHSEPRSHAYDIGSAMTSGSDDPASAGAEDDFMDFDVGLDEFADSIALVAKPTEGLAAPKSGGGHGIGGRDRDTSTTKTFFNLLKSFMGSGLLGLPHAFKEGGLAGSIVVMVGVCIIAASCNLMLVRCKQYLARRGVVSYSDIAVYTYGRWMGLATDALLIITQFGFCCVYLVFVSHNLTTWIPLSQDVILFASAPAFVLMSYIRTMTWIAPFSMAANVALVLGLTIILSAAILQLKNRVVPDVSLDIEEVAVWRTLPVTFGMAVYAYEGIGVILPCETAMKEPQKCAAVITVVMGIAFFLYTGFGAICYLAFGKHTSDQILENMAEFTTTAGQPWLALADVVRACLIFTVAATFPVQLFVVTDIVEQDYMFKSGRWRTHTLLTTNAFRTSLVFGAVLVAWLVPNFGALIGLIGSFGAAALQFIFPSLFFLKLFPEMSKARRAACVVFILIGSVGGLLGTIDSVSQLFAHH